ncbi:hypothetical protein LLG34_04305 [bacterium]|nr:hypothetical protein [bacterium]
MKKIIIIALLIPVLYGCSSFDKGLDNNLKQIARDIIENPYKIDSLQLYYPKYYKEEYFCNDLRDSSERRKIITFLQNEFPKRKGSLKIYNMGFPIEDLGYYRNCIKYKDIKENELLKFVCLKKGKGLSFHFVYDGENYYICSIGICIVYSGNTSLGGSY